MYLDSGNKSECFGCECCVQACNLCAITMKEDEEGFRYPEIDSKKCIQCGRCRRVCPHKNIPKKNTQEKYVFGGYIKDEKVRFNSTSGGAFSAIVEAFCDNDYYIFGAEAKGLVVFHSFIKDKSKLDKFRKSKYSQSLIGQSYRTARDLLKQGKKVLFTGTPCQIAGLLNFLGNSNRSNLLTVEVVCEGVPSPLYVRNMEKFMEMKYGGKIEVIDYRYTGKSLLNNGTWDFQKMKISLSNGKVIVKDRWFNPFWSIWLKHLMSRPSCYKCPFAESGRIADITLGDLWGVHIYCPELYGRNGGASLVICNSCIGKKVLDKAKTFMYGHELRFDDSIKYQSPLRKSISENEDRSSFMSDLISCADFRELNKKWSKFPTVKLLFQKYIWGNRQKICIWNLMHLKRGNAENGKS